MPIDFPNMDSLINRARLRGFRMPEEGETEAAYRNAFAAYMRPIDPVESMEIGSGSGWDKMSPMEMLAGLLGNHPILDSANLRQVPAHHVCSRSNCNPLRKEFVPIIRDVCGGYKRAGYRIDGCALELDWGVGVYTHDGIEYDLCPIPNVQNIDLGKISMGKPEDDDSCLFNGRPKQAYDAVVIGYGDMIVVSGHRIDVYAIYERDKFDVRAEIGNEIRQQTLVEWAKKRYTYTVNMNKPVCSPMVLRKKYLKSTSISQGDMDVVHYDTLEDAEAAINDINNQVAEYINYLKPGEEERRLEKRNDYCIFARTMAHAKYDATNPASVYLYIVQAVVD